MNRQFFDTAQVGIQFQGLLDVNIPAKFRERYSPSLRDSVYGAGRIQVNNTATLTGSIIFSGSRKCPMVYRFSAR